MRKHTRRKVYELVNPITHAMQGAAVTAKHLLDKLRMKELSAIESFRTGTATRHDWMAIADYLNLCECLALDGVGPEALEPCQMAQEALGSAHERLQRTGRLGVTGPELQALRDAYSFHDLQRQSISRSRYEDAIRTTAARIRSAPESVKVYA